MSSHAATGQQSLYYLYMQSEWSGPYQVDAIRSMVQKGEVPKDTYAYDSANQQHHTVEDLIAQPAAGQTSGGSSSNPSVGATRITDQSAQRLTVTLDDDVVDIAPAQTAATFERVSPELKSFYVSYLALSEHTSSDPQLSMQQLRQTHQALQEALAASNGAAFGKLINDIDEIGDYLANRHQISQLWQLVGDLEKFDHAAKPQESAQAAKAVLACLVERAERQKPSKAVGTVLLDVGDLDEDEHDSVATRKILLHSARDEVQNAKKDMDALHQTYTLLQEQHAKDLEQARKLLEKAESPQ